MPDHRFFKKPDAISLADLAAQGIAQVATGSNPSYMLEDVAPLDKAGEKDLSFFDNVKYKEQFLVTKAGACVVSEDMAKFAPKGVHLIISKSPYKAYALAAQKFYPEPLPEAKISKLAHVHESARIGDHCIIEPGVVIGINAEIGEGCWIEANAVIGDNVIVGAHSRVGANTSVSHAMIGAHTRIYPGARIGQDGFGFAIDPKGHVKVPQLGRVIIGDHVEIGANTCIDRGAGPDTVIGSGTWIDNLIQIGHNVRIGRGCVIAAQVGISGSTVIEDFVAIGGQAGFAGHLHIGMASRISAQAGVTRSIPPKTEVMGFPARPTKEFLRQMALLNRLVKNQKSG